MAEFPNPESPTADIISEYASAIGLLTIYWAALETAMLFMMEALLQTDEITARCIGTSLDKAASRATLIQRLVYRPRESPSPAWTECIAGLCGQISNVLGPERNRLIHDDWMPTDELMTRTNIAVKIGRPASRESKSLIQADAAPSRVSDIEALTTKVVRTMTHMSMQAYHYRLWKSKGLIPNIPEQAIRLSKGLPLEGSQSEIPEQSPPPQSSEV